MAPNRPTFSDPDLLGGTPEENDKAFRASNGYFGKYRIEGDVICCDIEVAQVPNMIGWPQLRAHRRRRTSYNF